MTSYQTKSSQIPGFRLVDSIGGNHPPGRFKSTLFWSVGFCSCTRSLSTDSMSLLCKRHVYHFQGPGRCRKLSKLSALLAFTVVKYVKETCETAHRSQKRPVTR